MTQKTKSWVLKLLIILGLLYMTSKFWLFWIFKKEAASIGIIGGADGPTAIFLTSSVPYIASFMTILVGLLFVIGIILIFKQRKNKK